MNDAIKMQVSAFVDGELPENEVELLIRRLSQDRELRQQLAEYQAIGRLLRGEPALAGTERLRERIAAELDERPLQEEDEPGTPSTAPKYLRSLTGLAIAAGVALIAILGLRESTTVEETGLAPETPVAAAEGYTVPQADDLLRQYRLMHAATSSEIGASNSISSRLDTLKLREVAATQGDGVIVTDGPPSGSDENPDAMRPE